jgi:hypothetical protein
MIGALYKELGGARWLLSLMLAVALAAAPAALYANGRVGQLVRQIAGPYEIALGTIPDKPLVGILHLTLTVSDAATKAPILDAEVTVAARGPDGDANEIGPLPARNSARDPAFYDVSTSVDRIGAWTFTVSVSSDLGDASTDFVLEVRNSSPIFEIFTWVTVVVFIAVIGLAMLPFLRGRRRGRDDPEKHSDISEGENR